jgi:hypothetical protein
MQRQQKWCLRQADSKEQIKKLYKIPKTKEMISIKLVSNIICVGIFIYVLIKIVQETEQPKDRVKAFFGWLGIMVGFGLICALINIIL